jgi:SPP1 gp7 family putative phage head morphogenesis protein
MSIRYDLESADAVAEKTLASVERQIANSYKAAYTDMKSVFADAFAKYETGGVLNYAEMQKYNRLKAMEVELNKTLKELYSKDSAILNRELSTVYKDNFYRTAYAIEKEVQAKLSYMPLDVARIKAAIQNPIPFGKTMQQTLGEHLAAVISKVNQEVTRSLIKGQSYGKTANAIKEVLGGDAKKAILVARTEGGRVQMTARYDSIQHADDVGIEMVKIWVSTLDNRTRDAHRSLDGKEVAVDEDFISEAGGKGPHPHAMGTAADDIQCRCTFITRPAGMKPEFRRVRGEGQIPYKTYKEWAEAKGIK